MLEFLPQNVKDALAYLNGNYLYEIRLRAQKPTTVNYGGTYRYLGKFGLTQRAEQAIVCDKEEIAACVYRAGEYSVYSVEEQIKRGFITAVNGERIGLCGEYVFENGKPLALRNFTSLCIRVPHEIIGSGAEIYARCMSEEIVSTLIVSPPGLGKTTILRDLGRLISAKTQKNVLVCDERGEISAGNTGESCDVLKYSDKRTAFESGIRALRPDIIITDELSIDDCSAVEKAIFAGITVIASAHFKSVDRIEKPFMGLFERYVVLKSDKIGEIDAVFDQNGRKIS